MTDARPVLVEIAYAQAGFLTSVAHVIQRDVPTYISVLDRDMHGIVRDRLDWPEERILVTPELYDESAPVEDLEARCLELEQRYGETLAMLASYNRGIGKGYLFNADRHPDVGRSWWPMERKWRTIYQTFRLYETILERISPRLIITIGPNKTLSLIARARGIPYLGVMSARIGDRYGFVDNEYLHSTVMRKRVEDNLAHPERLPDEEPEYAQITESRKNHAAVRFSYVDALKNSALAVARDAYKRLRALRVKYYQKNDSYRFAGWVPSMWRKVYSHRYFLKHGVRPQDLANTRYVYFPLHLEPEVALLSVSPEFNNSLEAIAWISKSLPADTVLLVKEHVFSFGIRSMTYYKHLRRIPNVQLAHPDYHSWDWLEGCAAVATISGTVGYEGVYFDRPVISFGAHQIINCLPVVRFADGFAQTRQAVQETLSAPPDAAAFSLSKRALHEAQLYASFDAPDLGLKTWDKKLEMEFAELTVTHLRRLYPDALPTVHSDPMPEAARA